MKQTALYKELAKYYDLVYSQKDYKKESKKIEEFIKKYKKSKGKELLEVACGTGGHLVYLESKFNCTGIDLNEEMLKIARKKLKKTKLMKANMINFNLGKKFDIILCLFSSIGYAKTYSNLKKTIKNFSNHLKKGGVLIIDDWFNKKTYRIGSTHMNTYEDDKIKIVRMGSSKFKKNMSILEMHYLIGEKDKGIKHFSEVHELGLFEPKPFLRILKDKGIEAKYIIKKKAQRGKYIGVMIR